MSILEFLTFSEVTKVNDKLDEINSQNKTNFQKEERKKVSADISSLFQSLYQNNNNIAQANLDNITNINSFINNEFNFLKNIKQPSRNIFYIILFGVFSYLSFTTYSHSGFSFILLFFVFFTLIFTINIYFTEKEITNYKARTRELKENLYFIKQNNPELSAYGIYFKWYLLNQLYDTIEAIKQHNEQKNEKNISPHKTMESLLKIFKINTKPYTDIVENNTIPYLNSDLIAIFDSINNKDVDNWQEQQFIYNFNKKNKSNEFKDANDFIYEIDKNYKLTIIPHDEKDYSFSITDEKDDTFFHVSRTGITVDEIKSMTEDKKNKILSYFFDIKDTTKQSSE